MSIKEKGEEIKSGTGAGQGGSPETFFLLDSPQKPVSFAMSPMVSGLIAGVLVTTGIGGYALGNYAAKGSILPAPVTPISEELQISRGVQTTTGNESSAASSTRVEGTGKLQSAAATMTLQGTYVGSRKGTKYHLPWCPGARAISEANKVWFESKQDAESQGYTPAANCKGI